MSLSIRERWFRRFANIMPTKCKIKEMEVREMLERQREDKIKIYTYKSKKEKIGDGTERGKEMERDKIRLRFEDRVVFLYLSFFLERQDTSHI